ncbi:restriction endonuclease [Streptomyces sp. NPDC086835]|uniref:restriction endonuclease n=1 Tax=Streptomyces sp. NPDC086835 TaxID=3365761 RepID=UPI00380F26FF
MRIQDISASVTLGLLLALPIEFLAQKRHGRQTRLYKEEIKRLEEENLRVRAQISRERDRRRIAWLAGLESSRRKRRAAYSPSMRDIDKESPSGFEATIQRLLERDGLKAEVIGGRGDQAVDVLAENLAGSKIAVQCKHTVSGRKVAAPVLYQINGTARAVYGASEIVVVTNGSFTRDAEEWGSRHGIVLIGRETLGKWSERADHLYQITDLSIPL